MSLSNWTSVVGTGVTVLLEATAPIVGTGSLRINRSGSGASGSFTYPISLPTGLAKGRLQTLFQVPTITADNTSDQLASLFFMVSTLSSPLTIATMYGFSAICRSSSPGPGVVGCMLGKATGSQNVSNQLGSYSFPTIPPGTTIALQVDWAYDPLQFSGTQIKARYKIGNDFLSMIEVFNIIDTSSPYTTSVAEALGISTSIGPSTYSVLFDETSLFDLVAA